ncbi:hypothetical protein ANCDUO_05649 [Ancylostoma duodenale]|uniref:DUF4140 domain-containing protein n=1 Tax=Ancylostoma duodenale TaxID=51022 RepID=A0A0C2H3N2_9BILA|nr:hypothetical protein ANCDUO_05649 [Ancylostoma duodenale]
MDDVGYRLPPSSATANVSAVIERQSVRVDGRGALIQEVQYQEMPIDTEHEDEKIRSLEREKLSVENERFAVEDEMCSLRKRIEVLDGVAGQVSASITNGYFIAVKIR